MKSIRRRLTISLLGGLLLLWILSGSGIYVAVRSSLLKELDAELAVDAQVLRFVARGNTESDEGIQGSLDPAGRGRATRRLQARIPAYDIPASGSFYQGWKSDRTIADKSPSLGPRELPFPEGTGPDASFSTTLLDDGTRVRAMSFQVSPGGRGRSKGARRQNDTATTIMIARDLHAVEDALGSLLGGILVVGLLACGGTFLLVGAALKRGLRPLHNLGAQAREIDVTSLNSRFDGAGATEELQPIYRRLNGLMDRLESSFERERRFSSDLAHEMRTPIAELKMLSEVALKWPDQADSKTHRDCLEIADQLEEMVDNLLSLARWESGEQPLEEEDIDLESLVRERWKSHSAKAEEKNLKTTFNFRVKSIVSDRGMLTHIVNNLLSNAVEYTPEGGEIEIVGHAGGVEIANTVSEVSRDDVRNFFDRYWRRDKVRGESRHAGLGLSLAKACAEALGLTLDARLEGQMVRLSLG